MVVGAGEGSGRMLGDSTAASLDASARVAALYIYGKVCEIVSIQVRTIATDSAAKTYFLYVSNRGFCINREKRDDVFSK